MGTDFSIRPVGVPAAPPVVRSSSDATTSAVPTQLPAPQAASPTTAAAGAANSSQGSQSVLSQTVVVDRAANTVVYQTINQQTGQVLNQFPDDAVLQARAYFRALDEAQLEKSQGLLDQTA